MELIQLKIQKDDSAVKYIKILRKFDSALPVSTLKQRMENNDFAIAFDLDCYDVVDELNGIDRKEVFRHMIEELMASGASVAIYWNGELSSLEFFDNRLAMINETRRMTEEDVDREAEE